MGVHFSFGLRNVQALNRHGCSASGGWMRSLKFSISIATVGYAALLIFVGGPVASGGQAHLNNAIQGYGHQAWQAPEGLPQDSVQAILQTRDGFLWVGTERGLVRFDGRS